MSYLTRFSQNVTADTNNSSTTNLAGLASFIGLPTSTMGVAGIQVGFRSDQNCTILVQQSQGLVAGIGTVTTTNPGGTGTITGSATTKFLRDFSVGDQIVIVGEAATRYIATIASDTVMTTTVTCTGVAGAAYTFYPWDISDSYSYKYQNNTNFGKTVQAILSYVRVKVTNLSSSVTTLVFRLNTVLCPIVESIPRSLSSDGYLQSSVKSITDALGTAVKVSPQGGMRTVEVSKLIGVSFTGTTIDASFWAKTEATGGTGTQTGGQFELLTAVTDASSASLQSIRSSRYVNGCSNLCRVICDFGGSAGSYATNTRRWGVFTGAINAPTDGAMFEVIDQVISIATYKASNPTRVVNGAFNGEMGTTINSLAAGVQTCEIVYTNKDIYFYVNNLLLHHTIASTATWTDTLNLPLRAENINTGTTTGSSLKIRSFTVFRYGKAEARPAWKYTHGVLSAANGILKRGAGTLHGVVNGNNKGTLAIYDALSATNQIALIDLTIVLGTQEYDLDFYTGLTMVQTDAASDTTIIFE